jgi:hypothetical protein
MFQKEVMNNDPTANRLAYNGNLTPDDGKTAGGLWDPNSRTLSIGPARTYGGTTLTHERGHSWGLPEENQMPSSPIYEQDNKTGSGAMSYGQDRSIQQYEVQYGANKIFDAAKGANAPTIRVHVVGSTIRPHTILK